MISWFGECFRRYDEELTFEDRIRDDPTNSDRAFFRKLTHVSTEGRVVLESGRFIKWSPATKTTAVIGKIVDFSVEEGAELNRVRFFRKLILVADFNLSHFTGFK